MPDNANDWLGCSQPRTRRLASDMTRTRRSPEKRVQTAIVRNLRTMGFWVNSFSQARASKQTPGIPDLYVWHTRFRVSLWIEVKAGKNKLSTDQLVWHREAKACGIHVCVAYGMEDVIQALKQLGVPIE